MTDAGDRPPPIDLDARVTRVPLDEAWSASVGFESWADPDDDEVIRGRLPITERVCQPMGLLHGGIYACIGEELASIGTARQVMEQGRWAVGMSNNTSFFRPGLVGGVLTAVARPIHRGRTTWVWDVEILDDDERLCARSTVTMAVRDGPPSPPPA